MVDIEEVCVVVHILVFFPLTCLATQSMRSTGAFPHQTKNSWFCALGTCYTLKCDGDEVKQRTLQSNSSLATPIRN